MRLRKVREVSLEFPVYLDCQAWKVAQVHRVRQVRVCTQTISTVNEITAYVCVLRLVFVV